MKRRSFLKAAGVLASQTFIASTLLDSVFIATARGGTVDVASLRRQLNPAEATVLVPTDRRHNEFEKSFNLAHEKIVSSVRVLCKTSGAVVTALAWAKANNIPLAMRAGGHSYEAFSRSTGMVIDVREMNSISISGETMVTGSGSMLGSIYTALSKKGLALPAGSCPTVGVTGHTTGGGYGLLARPFGLACDSLLSVEIVMADGKILTASETENPELFWAVRGGGGGSFGVITKLNFKAHKLTQVNTFLMTWGVSAANAAPIVKAWQQWAPDSPNEITSLMKVSKDEDGLIQLRCVGQSIGSEQTIRRELARISRTRPVAIKSRTFIGAVQHFSGGDEDPTEYMKGKSDYVKQVMSDEGLATMLRNIPEGIASIFDSYGGAINNKSETETAFAHRAGTISSVQHYTKWESADETEGKRKVIRKYYDSLRNYMSGSAYVNYCDLDLQNYAEAYWGHNLARLKDIKSQYDPENFFKHAQSVPAKS